MSAPLQIAQRTVGDVVILDLAGRLVFDEGDRLLRERVAALLAAGSRALLIHLEDVSYIDSGGIGALVEMYLNVTREGGRLKLLCPSKCADRVLHITRLTTVFEIFEDEAAALASFSSIAA